MGVQGRLDNARFVSHYRGIDYHYEFGVNVVPSAVDLSAKALLPKDEPFSKEYDVDMTTAQYSALMGILANCRMGFEDDHEKAPKGKLKLRIVKKWNGSGKISVDGTPVNFGSSWVRDSKTGLAEYLGLSNYCMNATIADMHRLNHFLRRLGVPEEGIPAIIK